MAKKEFIDLGQKIKFILLDSLYKHISVEPVAQGANEFVLALGGLRIALGAALVMTASENMLNGPIDEMIGVMGIGYLGFVGRDMFRTVSKYLMVKRTNKK